MEVGVVIILLAEEVTSICVLSPANFISNFIVTCLSIVHPTNGVVDCSLGDDGVLSYEDTCSFTCNTGYELTGGDNRTCQSDGNWSGSEITCKDDGMLTFLKCMLTYAVT